MKKGWLSAAVCALAVLVSSCGGGGDAAGPGPAAPSAAAMPAPGPLRAEGQPQRSVAPFTGPTLFEWAQQNFPQFFSGPSTDGVAGNFTYRFYSNTSTYLAVSTDGGVYVKGPAISNDAIRFIAPLALVSCVVSPGVCPAMAVGASATGTVAAAGERDWHTVSLAAGQAYSFALEGSATAQGTLLDPVLRLFNSAGQHVAADDDSGVSFNSAMVCAPSASGVYYLAAEGAGGEIGSYRLTITALAGAATPCENLPEDTSIPWSSIFSAPEILQGTVTLAAQQTVGANFNVTGASLALEAIFVSQGSADLYVMNSGDLAACLNGGSFDFIAQASLVQQSGFRSFTLAPGSYSICARNLTAVPNTMRLELQNQPAVPGFHFSQQHFSPVAQTIAAGGRFAQQVLASDVFRTLVDGASTGGIFYIIPATETEKFLAGQPFEHYPELTALCGGLGAAGTAAPELCELHGVGQYGIAYVNNTASPQSIVVVGRDYVPD